MDCFLSIIIPVYNVEKYLDRCLASIENQTFTDFEVIMIDDGSTDMSGEICDRYAKSHKNFRVIHKPNGGLGSARNKGLENACGNYVTFVDSDDYIENDMMEKMYVSIIENNADTCMCGYKKIRGEKVYNYKHVYANQVFTAPEIITQVIPKFVGKTSFGNDNIEMSVCMAMFSMKIIRKHNLFFYSERDYISEDLLFDLDYYRYARRVAISDAFGYCYCDNDNSLTTRYNKNRFKLQKKLFLHLQEKTEELGIFDLCKERMQTTLLSSARYCIKLETKYRYIAGNKDCKKRIAKICNDEVIKDILKHYPLKNVPFKSRLVNYMIKWKTIRLLYITMLLKLYFNI